MRGLAVVTLVSVLISCPLLAHPSTARAQCDAEPEPSPATRAAARPHYRNGIEASRAERWMEARESFERAAGIVPLSPIIYNLATAQSETGMLVEAAENYRRFLRRCVSRQTPELRAEAQQLLAAIAPRVGRLVLRIDNVAGEVDSVIVDGEPITLALLGTEMPANPGTHQVRVTRRGTGELTGRDVTIREGQTSTVSLSIPEYVPPATEEGTGSTGGGGGGGDDIGLIVGLTVGGVLLAGGVAALTTALVLGGQGGVDLPMGSFGGQVARVPLVEF